MDRPRPTTVDTHWDTREGRILGVLEKFQETEICPKQHDRYVKEGKWQSHVVYCVCDCSYCQEAKLRKENGDSIPAP